MPVFTDDALQSALRALVSVVREFELNGRPCLGANLKPEFLRKAGLVGAEVSQRFHRFGDFLRLAEASGAVRVVVSDKDLQISVPSGRRQPENTLFPTVPEALSVVSSRARFQSEAETPQVPLRVRPDLWRAFNANVSGWYYVVDQDVAQRLPHVPVQDSDPPRFIPIPSARVKMHEWMSAFAEVQEPEMRSTLKSVLESSANIYQFESVVRSRPALLRSWRRFHVQQVIAAIEAWASANKIRPRELVRPYLKTQAGAPQAPELASLPRSANAVEQVHTVQELGIKKAGERTQDPYLTQRLATMIEDMIGELIRLRGIIEVMHPGRNN